MNNKDNLYNEPELNILEKIFFQFYSEKICEEANSNEYIEARKDEAIKYASFNNAMSNECRERYYEYECARNRVESHLQYQSFLLGIKFSKEIEEILKTDSTRNKIQISE